MALPEPLGGMTVRPMTASDGQDEHRNAGNGPRRAPVYVFARGLIGVATACAQSCGRDNACSATGGGPAPPPTMAFRHATAGTRHRPGSRRRACRRRPRLRMAVHAEAEVARSGEAARWRPLPCQGWHRDQRRRPPRRPPPRGRRPAPGRLRRAVRLDRSGDQGSARCTSPSFSSFGPVRHLEPEPLLTSTTTCGHQRYSVSQTIYACSYGNWYVDADMRQRQRRRHVRPTELPTGFQATPRSAR